MVVLLYPALRVRATLVVWLPGSRVGYLEAGYLYQPNSLNGTSYSQIRQQDLREPANHDMIEYKALCTHQRRIFLLDIQNALPILSHGEPYFEVAYVVTGRWFSDEIWGFNSYF